MSGGCLLIFRLAISIRVYKMTVEINLLVGRVNVLTFKSEYDTSGKSIGKDRFEVQRDERVEYNVRGHTKPYFLPLGMFSRKKGDL